LSILSGAHLGLVKQVIDELAANDDLAERKIVVGGTISRNDAATLRAMGVADVFHVRTPLEELAPRVAAVVQR
jgi:methylmalonyl-CoA mutase cobalamin-binding domain/chain